ncbi:transposase [Streptomyces stelliscabiei]|uniref:transposase n=1 Tax=Streptomyces stelliscabiei TaxID=146820 RepID=UPI000B297E1A
MLQQEDRHEAFVRLSRFRSDFYDCLNGRADALFALTDADLHGWAGQDTGRSRPGAGTWPWSRCLVRRLGQGACGNPLAGEEDRGAVAAKAAEDRLVLAVDVSPWLRPDAATCPDRSFCRTYGRGEAKHQMMPGWPYSVPIRAANRRTTRSPACQADGARLSS